MVSSAVVSFSFNNCRPRASFEASVLSSGKTAGPEVVYQSHNMYVPILKISLYAQWDFLFHDTKEVS